MIYNVNYDIASIAILAFVTLYIFLKKGLARVSNRVFLAVVIIEIVSAISDILSSYYNSFPIPGQPLNQDIWNYIYLGVHNVMPALFVVYIICMLGIDRRMTKVAWIFLCIPVAFVLISLALNFNYHFVFYYDERGTYLHGPVFLFVYAVAFLYIIIAIVLIARNWRQLTPRKRYPLIFFVLISIAPVVMQAFYHYLLIEIFCQSLGLLGILLSIENAEDVISRQSGLRNRYAFLDAIPHVFSDKHASVIIVKISNINYYNTTIGVDNVVASLHAIGSYFRNSFAAYRAYDIGNGHFALVGEGNSAGDVERVFRRFQEPWERLKLSVKYPVEICGISLGTDVESLEELLLICDTEYIGKETRIIAARDVIEEHKRRILVEHLIEKALRNNTLQVYYQPIWERETNKFHSAEALVRLIDDEYGFISPEEFIPISEKNGTILEIGEYVFTEVAHTYQSRNLEDAAVDYIEVNLSPVQCADEGLRALFDSILKKYNLSAEHFNLEITETAAISDDRMQAENLDRLKDMGFTFSLDDYGTGYSNFSYMRKMPFSIIKLDKSILWSAISPKDGARDANSVIFLKNTIGMLKEMKYHTLVEGVETVEQKLFLEEIGCDYFQGYYFSKPVPQDVFVDYVKVVNV